ncbi:MAG: hypothetical protein E5V78_34935, partial [Mesorhizobium sp.]
MSAGNPTGISGRSKSCLQSRPTNDSFFLRAIPNLLKTRVKSCLIQVQRSSFVRTPARPPLDGLKKRLERSR